LLGEINLKADMINNFIRFFWAVRYTAPDGDDSDEIDEALATFTVVHDGGLTFLVSRKGLSQVGHGIWGNESTLLTLVYVSIWGLQETAVATKNLMLLVLREAVESGRGIDDGTIVATDINDSERAGTVDRTEDDIWMGA